MDRSIEVDEALLLRAQRLSGIEEDRRVVEQALEEMIRRRSKLDALLALAGKVHFHDDYDHKKLRAGDDESPA